MTIESEKSKPVVSDYQKVDQSKRSLTKAGLTVPVIMTLAGRPVMGSVPKQCVSQEMSGNASYTGEGSCQSGDGPQYWGSPGSSTPGSLTEKEDEFTATVNATWHGTGNINSTTNKTVTINKTVKSSSTPYLWTGPDVHYGDLIIIDTIIVIRRDNTPLPDGTTVNIDKITTNFGDNSITVGQTFTVGTTKTNGNGDSGTQAYDCANFSGGTTFGLIFDVNNDEPIRKILCESPEIEEAYVIAAYLNAMRNPTNYVLKPDQVVALYKGAIPVPPNYNDLSHFLGATWS